MSFATSSSSSSRVFRGCRALLAPAKSAASAAVAALKPANAKPKPRTESATPARPRGILKAVPVSPALRDFVGVSEVSRTDAVKKIWAHVKQNNLQNPADKREIFCDDKLKAIFDGKDKVGFLEIAKLLSRHFVKTS